MKWRLQQYYCLHKGNIATIKEMVLYLVMIKGEIDKIVASFYKQIDKLEAWQDLVYDLYPNIDIDIK